MDTVFNPTATLQPPRSSGAAVEKSALKAATGAAECIGGPRHRPPGHVGGTGGNVLSANSQIVCFGDLEAIVSPSFTSSPAVSAPICAPMSDCVQKETRTSTNFDKWILPDDDDVDTVTHQELHQECSESNNDNGAKKPAWNKPSNVASSAEVTSVMGAESWPALSESTRSSPQPFSESTRSSPKPFSSGMHKGSIYPAAQLSSARSSSRISGTFDALTNSDNFANDSSSRDRLHQRLHQNGEQRGRPQLHHGNDRPQLHHGNDRPHRSFRGRGNGGSRFHGNRSVHNDYGYGYGYGYGGRQDQEHGNHEWNSNRSFVGTQRAPPLTPLMRGPTPPPLPFPPLPFVPPSRMPIHTLGLPAVYAGPPNPFAPFSLGPPMLPMVYDLPHLQELPTLQANVVSQIDYYFSDKNLIKDIFLRQQMDDQGWVPIQLIASFNKVKQLTNNVQFLLDAMRSSSVVEVEGEKLRRRNEWEKWLIPASLKYSTILSPRSRDDIDKKINRQ